MILFVCFLQKRKFTVSSIEGKKYCYYASSDEKARYLLHFARLVHQKTMALHSEQAVLCRQEMNGKAKPQHSTGQHSTQPAKMVNIFQ